MHVPWGISRVLEEGRQIPSRGRGQKITSALYFTDTSSLLSILISHPVSFFLCHTCHCVSLSEFRKDQDQGCLPFWHPRETRSCQQSWWGRCWRRAGTRCCWLMPHGHAGCICTSHCNRREQECSTLHSGWYEQHTTLGESRTHCMHLPSYALEKWTLTGIPHLSTVTNPSPLVFASQ